MKAIIITAIAITAALSTSCNTMIGVGRDMRVAGEGMEKAAGKASGNNTHDSNHSGAPVY